MRKFKNFKIFIADKIHSEGIEILKRAGFNVIECYNKTNNLLLETIGNKTTINDSNSCLIIRSVRTIEEEDIDFLKSCSVTLLCTASSGFDNIAVKHCRKRGIKAMNVPLGNYVSAAEHTIAMILSVLKSLNEADKDVKKGIFDEKKYVNYDFSGKKIGIIGVGRVGSHVAKICKAFGATIIGNDIRKTLKERYKWIKFKELDALLKEADIVSIHTPLDDTTLNLIDSRRLHYLRRSAILINCARGGIVDENMLIKMLNRKKIYYAGLDVFNNEPRINKDFRNLNNVILTPHLAGKTVESRRRISVQLARRVVEYYSQKVTKMH